MHHVARQKTLVFIQCERNQHTVFTRPKRHMRFALDFSAKRRKTPFGACHTAGRREAPRASLPRLHHPRSTMTLHARALSAALSIGLLSSALSASAAPPHWTYTGSEGAAHWSEIDASFAQCALGHQQSPIDITRTVKTALPQLVFHYGSATPTIWNNGHTVQVNLPPGNTLQVGDQTYELLQFHFHTPSEERIQGKSQPMVVHFVHKTAAGELGVVAVLIKAGRANPALSPVFEHLPRKGEKITVDELSLDLAALLPASLGYYDFAGSLTTPPCSEGVHWMVLKTPTTLSSQQPGAFRKLIGSNERPVQALNGREVKESE